MITFHILNDVAVPVTSLELVKWLFLGLLSLLYSIEASSHFISDDSYLYMTVSSTMQSLASVILQLFFDLFKIIFLYNFN